MEANLIVYFAQEGVSCRSHRSLPALLPRSIFGPVEEHTEERLHTHKVCSGQSYAGLQHAGWLHPMQKKQIRSGFVLATRLTSVASSNRQEVRMMDSMSSI